MTFDTALLALSPIAYYRLGESSGTTVVDSSGNGHDAIFGGSPTFGQSSLVGDSDTAVRFDPADYLKIATADSWQRTDAFTWVLVVSGWDGVSFANLIDRNDGAQSLWLGTDGRLRAFINTTSDGAGTLFDGNSASMPGTIPSPGDAHLVGLSYADPTAKSYLDGVPSPGSILHGRGAMTGDLYLGSVPADPSSAAITIDEFAIFDRALTETEWTGLQAAMTPSDPLEGVPTDTSNLAGGRSRGGTAENLSLHPVVALPAGAGGWSGSTGGLAARDPIQVVAHRMPRPTLVDGRPV